MKGNWTGPHDNSTPVGNGITVFENVYTGTNGEINRRPGLTAYDTWPGITYMTPLSSGVIAGFDSVNVKKYNVSSKVSTTLGSYTTPTACANLYGNTYVVNGILPSEVNTTTVRAMGLASPATPTIVYTSTVGTPTVGTHLVRMRRHEFSTSYNRYSDPSDAVEIEFREAVIDLTVTSGVITAKISDPGIGYRPSTTYTLTVVGDGTSANITFATDSNPAGPKVISVTVASSGSGYTYATSVVPPPDATISTTSTAEEIEYTLSGGNLYYSQTHSTSNKYNLDDNITIGLTNTYFYAGPDGFGHEAPPTGLTLLCAHRNRLFGWGANYLYWSRSGFPESWKASEWARKVSNFGSDTTTALFSVFDDLYIASLRGMKRFVYVSDPASAMIVDIPTNFGCWNNNSVVFAEGRVFGFGPMGMWEIKGVKPQLIGQVLEKQWASVCDFTLSQSKAYGFYDSKNRRVLFYYVKTGDTICKRAMCLDLTSGLFSITNTLEGVTSAVETLYGNQSSVFMTGSSYLHILDNSATTDNGLAITFRILGDLNPGAPNVDRRRFEHFLLETVPIANHSELKVQFYLDGSSTPYSYPLDTDTNTTFNAGCSFNPAEPTVISVTPINGFAAIPATSEYDRYVRFEIISTATTGDIRITDADYKWIQTKDMVNQA